jgi:hypothetical protein
MLATQGVEVHIKEREDRKDVKSIFPKALPTFLEE